MVISTSWDNAIDENNHSYTVADERPISFLSIRDVETNVAFSNTTANVAAVVSNIGQPGQEMELQVASVHNNTPSKTSFHESDSMENGQICALPDTNHTNNVDSAIFENNAIPMSCEKKVASFQKVHVEALNWVQNHISVASYVCSQELACRSSQSVHTSKPPQTKHPLQSPHKLWSSRELQPPYQLQSPHKLVGAKARVEIVQYGGHNKHNSQFVLDVCLRERQTQLPTPCIPLQVCSVVKTSSSGTAHPKEKSWKTATGKSCATHNEAGGGGGAPPSSNTGQSFHRDNGQPNRSPFPSGERNQSLSDQPNSSVAEVDSSQHVTAVLVVQADVNRIMTKNRVSGDSGELVLASPKIIDPGGKSELVRCVQYSIDVQASQSYSETGYLRTNAYISDAHQNSCSILFSNPSSPTIHSAPVLDEEGESSSFLSKAKDVASHSAFGSSLVVAETPAHSLLLQLKSSRCSLTSSHFVSVASKEIESKEEDFYWIEAQTEAVAGCVSSPVLMNSYLPFPCEESSLSVSVEPPVPVDEVAYWIYPETESAFSLSDQWEITSEPVYPSLK